MRRCAAARRPLGLSACSRRRMRRNAPACPLPRDRACRMCEERRPLHTSEAGRAGRRSGKNRPQVVRSGPPLRVPPPRPDACAREACAAAPRHPCARPAAPSRQPGRRQGAAAGPRRGVGKRQQRPVTSAGISRKFSATASLSPRVGLAPSLARRLFSVSTDPRRPPGAADPTHTQFSWAQRY